MLCKFLYHGLNLILEIKHSQPESFNSQKYSLGKTLFVQTARSFVGAIGQRDRLNPGRSAIVTRERAGIFACPKIFNLVKADPKADSLAKGQIQSSVLTNFAQPYLHDRLDRAIVVSTPAQL